jgi:hypothetical protein
VNEEYADRAGVVGLRALLVDLTVQTDSLLNCLLMLAYVRLVIKHRCIAKSFVSCLNLFIAALHITTELTGFPAVQNPSSTARTTILFKFLSSSSLIKLGATS